MNIAITSKIDYNYINWANDDKESCYPWNLTLLVNESLSPSSISYILLLFLSPSLFILLFLSTIKRGIHLYISNYTDALVKASASTISDPLIKE